MEIQAHNKQLLFALIVGGTILGLAGTDLVLPAIPTLPDSISGTPGQAFTLGGLLIFVFGAPTVIINGMGGDLSDFVMMQVIGISLFIIASNTAHFSVERFGPELTIWFGSGLAAIGSVAIALYALISEDHEPAMLWLMFSFVNLGLGFRGPHGFYQAIIASGDNDARGAALVILMVFCTTAAGTAALAPFITLGLLPLAATAAAVSVCSLVALSILPPMAAGTPGNIAHDR